jgi:ABC-type phosphate transport system substrate-binding protein
LQTRSAPPRCGLGAPPWGVSPEWKSGPGVGKSVNFPAGVGGKGNPGVTALITQTPGTIGYVEYGYAKQMGTPMAVLESKSRNYVKADPASEKAALASVELPPDLRAWIPNPSAPGLPHRHLHADPDLQEVRRPQDRGRAQERHPVLSDRQAEVQRRAWVHSAAGERRH